MKTNAKVLKNVGLLFIFIACLSFGYILASKIWRLGDIDIYLITNGIVCLFFALLMFRQAKKKKAEEEKKKQNQPITRTICVSCLSRFLLLLLHSRQICNGCCTRTPAFAEATAVKARICPQLNCCTVINSWLRDSLYPRFRFASLPGHRRDTRTSSNKFVPGRQKSAPYPPRPNADVVSRAGLHRDSFLAKVSGPARMLRRVTQPPHIAGPLPAIAIFYCLIIKLCII